MVMMLNWGQLLLRVEHVDSPQVSRLEVVLHGKRIANSLRDLVVVQSLVIQPDSPEVTRILQGVHYAERDVDRAIDVAIALLHPCRHNSDHLEGHAINANVLPECIHSRKQFRLGIVAQYSHSPMREIILVVQETSVIHIEIPDCTRRRIHTRDRQGERTRARDDR
jgi:hypothetical protein